MKTNLLAAAAFLSLLLAAPAAAAGPPSATTGAATGIGTGRATLNGSVATGGETTSWRFEYGPTPAYGASTPVQRIPASPASRGVSAPVGNLAPGHTYHFALVVASAAGTSVGADGTFTTGGSPPGATTLAAGSVGLSGARLNGVVDPKGFPTSWYFVYGTTTAYGGRTPTESAGAGTRNVSVSVPVGGLAAGTGYHFELVASSAVGTSVGGDLTLTTIGVPAVQALGAEGLTPSSAMLAGTVNGNGEPASYQFDYGTTTAYGSTTPSANLGPTTGATAVNAQLANLAPGTTYHFRLVASSAAGTNASADVTLTTPAAVVLNAGATRVVAGHYVELSGTAFGGQPGVSVTILAQPLGAAAPTTVGTVLTGGAGAWNYLARPSIQTTYTASAESGTSGPLVVGVAPAVSLQAISGSRLFARVGAGGSMTGRFVQLQRLVGGRWRTLARARLGTRSSATFAASLLPFGRSTIRVAMSVNQAGPGYLGGFSRELSVTRAHPRHRAPRR
jgi:Tfp pilus assembly protein PilV